MQSGEGRSRRPLRTYGRQPTQSAATTDSTTESSVTKRRRISDDGDTERASPSKAAKMTAKQTSPLTTTPKTTSSPATPRRSQQQTLAVEKRPRPSPGSTQPQPPAALPTQANILPPTSSVRKGTITSYFRVVPHLNSDSSSCSSDHTPSALQTAASTMTTISHSSPPSSPPPLHQEDSCDSTRASKRKPRRLTTKAKARDLKAALKVTDDEEGEDEREVSARPKSGKGRSVMTETKPSSLNQEPDSTTTTTANNKAPPPAELKTKQSTATKKTTMIQQTLSLSMSEKGFTECRECNMLYNPLHEKDVRFHARQHAAILKARVRRDQEEEEEEEEKKQHESSRGTRVGIRR